MRLCGRPCVAHCIDVDHWRRLTYFRLKGPMLNLGHRFGDFDSYGYKVARG